MQKEGKEMPRYKGNFDHLEWQSSLPGARFKAFQQGTLKLRLVEFAKGFAAPEWCTKGHVGYVLEGQADVDFDGEIIRFSTGDGVFVPEGEENKHKVTVLSEVVRLILVEDA